MRFFFVIAFVLVSCGISYASSAPPQPIKLTKDEALRLGFSVEIIHKDGYSETELKYPKVINNNWFPYLGGWSVQDGDDNTLAAFSADLPNESSGRINISVKLGLGKQGAWVLYECRPTKSLECKQRWPKAYMFENLETWN